MKALSRPAVIYLVFNTFLGLMQIFRDNLVLVQDLYRLQRLVRGLGRRNFRSPSQGHLERRDMMLKAEVRGFTLQCQLPSF